MSNSTAPRFIEFAPLLIQRYKARRRGLNHETTNRGAIAIEIRARGGTLGDIGREIGGVS